MKMISYLSNMEFYNKDVVWAYPLPKVVVKFVWHPSII